MAYSERKSKLDATEEWRTQYAFHFCFRRYSISSPVFISDRTTFKHNVSCSIEFHHCPNLFRINH